MIDPTLIPAHATAPAHAAAPATAPAVATAAVPTVTQLTVNGRSRLVAVTADTPLLWVLRDELDCTGVKFGCGVGSCGACTVHLNGRAVRSCVVPVGAAAGGKVITIEGLAADAGLPPGRLHPVQEVP